MPIRLAIRDIGDVSTQQPPFDILLSYGRNTCTAAIINAVFRTTVQAFHVCPVNTSRNGPILELVKEAVLVTYTKVRNIVIVSRNSKCAVILVAQRFIVGAIATFALPETEIIALGVIYDLQSDRLARKHIIGTVVRIILVCWAIV